MEPPAPVTKWLDDFDTVRDVENVQILQNLKDNNEDLSELHLMGGCSERWNDDQYVLGYCDRETHWLACFLSRSTQVRSLRLSWMGKTEVSLKRRNFLIEGMNCLTTIEDFLFDHASTMGLDSHEEMFERLQPFFKNNPIETFELERFEFYESDGSDDFDVKKEKKFIRALEKAIKAANVKRVDFASENNFSIRGAVEILEICESFKDLRLDIGREVHKHKIELPGRCFEYAIPAFLKRGRLANLHTLLITADDMGRDEFIELLDALRDNDTLKELYLIGTADDACQLDDDFAERMCNTMGRNRTLKKLCLRINNSNLTSAGLNSLKRLLCNTDSIDATFESNHSLVEVGFGLHIPVPWAEEMLRPLFEINEKFKHNEAAILKILAYHEFVDMRPLFGWEYRLLPLVISCIHRAMNAVFFNASGQSTPRLKKIEETKLTSIYQFVRELPDLYIDSVLGLTTQPKEAASRFPKRLKVS